jgi:hypothetical protein
MPTRTREEIERDMGQAAGPYPTSQDRLMLIMCEILLDLRDGLPHPIINKIT